MTAWQMKHCNDLYPSKMGRRLPWVSVALATAIIVLAMELGFAAVCVMVCRGQAQRGAHANQAARSADAVDTVQAAYGVLAMHGDFCSEARRVPQWAKHVNGDRVSGWCSVEGVLFPEDGGGYTVRREGMALSVPASALPTRPE